MLQLEKNKHVNNYGNVQTSRSEVRCMTQKHTEALDASEPTISTHQTANTNTERAATLNWRQTAGSPIPREGSPEGVGSSQ